MTENRTRRADGAATAALLVVILLLSIALAAWTEWHIVVRGAVAFGAGMIAAAITYILVRRATK